MVRFHRFKSKFYRDAYGDLAVFHHGAWRSIDSIPLGAEGVNERRVKGEILNPHGPAGPMPEFHAPAPAPITFTTPAEIEPWIPRGQVMKNAPALDYRPNGKQPRERKPAKKKASKKKAAKKRKAAKRKPKK